MWLALDDTGELELIFFFSSLFSQCRDMQATARVQRSEDNFVCLFSPSALFEVGSLYSCIHQTKWPSSFLGFSCLHLPSHLGSAGITDVLPDVQLFVVSEGPNSGSHAYRTSAYPPSHPPRPGVHFRGVLISLWLQERIT